MRGVMLTVVAAGLLVLTSSAAVAVEPQAPAGFEADSTQAVCALTGNHGDYVEKPANYVSSDFGLNSGDSGSSFEFDGKVWWLFGNSGANMHPPWGKANATSRWPAVSLPLDNPAALGSDSIATSPEKTKPPAPTAPYNDTTMPPDQHCPALTFIRQTANGPYANPSVSPDPLFKKTYFVSLRKGELPEAGISEGHPAKMYVVFGTDNPANCASLAKHPGPCAEPTGTDTLTPCSGQKAGSRTRSVMAVYDGARARFEGLYDLSKPSSRYGPDCPTAPDADTARFVNVQMQNGPDGYVYIWGTEGGANNEQSPVYLARIPAADIATKKGIAYWDGTAFVGGKESKAAPLFTDRPAPCVAQLGIQHNPYLGEWIMLYHCKESPAPANHPNGIYMRTAPNPWGPWSAPTTIFNPDPDQNTRSGYCYFIYSTQTWSPTNMNGYPRCPAGSPNSSLADSQSHVGNYYGPYFVANWTTGTAGTARTRASTTIYYTLDTFDPYGQLIMRSTILGTALPTGTKPTPPHCKGTTCS